MEEQFKPDAIIIGTGLAGLTAAMEITEFINNLCMEEQFKPDAIIIGTGLAGLTAAMEITDTGKKVLLLDQETEKNIGGQAFWSFGGLFLINSPQQRRMGIKDSYELARQDWLGTAGFDRVEDDWPRQWAEAYLKFAAGEKYAYISKLGIKLMFMVGWAERGDGSASGHGNSVPRFHVSWGDRNRSR